MIIDTLKLGIECAPQKIYLIQIKDKRLEEFAVLCNGKSSEKGGIGGAVDGIKMTVSIKSRQRNGLCHPSRGTRLTRTNEVRFHPTPADPTFIHNLCSH